MAIKAVAMDVDGVLTDGTVLLDESGRESKRIHFSDVMGISIGRRAGLLFALISGEAGPMLEVIAAKLGITEVYPGCRDKAAALKDFAARHQLELADICYIGDDVNDVTAMEISGLSAAPADAQRAAAAAATLTTARPGGAGAVREIIEVLLSEPAHFATPSGVAVPDQRRRSIRTSRSAP